MDRKACEKLGRIGVVISIAWSLAIPAPAQPLRLDDLPATTGNTRFFEDAFAVRHPSLSLNGFSCAALNARTPLDLPTHADALQHFKEGLLEPQVYSVAESLNDDAVR